MQEPHYSYGDTLATAQRVAFHLDDVLGELEPLDFDRPFLPESLARVRGLTFLSQREQLRLNQIRAHAYLCTFGLVEEFILPFVLDHARAALDVGDARTRALLQFAGEEAKHIELFRRFAASFERGFGTSCAAVGPARAVADTVLAHAPLGVALAILHIEWMTQRHYLASVRSDEQLDPHFKSLLKYHFVEECQHAKLDTLITCELAERLTGAEIESRSDDYFAITAAFEGLIGQQVELDLVSFERDIGRSLAEPQRALVRESQRAAAGFTYLGSGMSHPSFAGTLARLSPHCIERLRAAASRFV